MPRSKALVQGQTQESLFVIRWIFLDVGNVLLDEDPLTYFVFREYVDAIRLVRPAVSFADLLAAREARAAGGSRWATFETVVEYLGEPAAGEVWERIDHSVRERYAQLCPPILCSLDLVRDLARSGRYRLGLIANQPRECRQVLANLGIERCFEVTVLSEETGFWKPDTRIFREALERAGALASECLMVGDRFDTDIAPAAALGMATVWIRWPDRLAKGWRPFETDARLYIASLERIDRESRPRGANTSPAPFEIATPGDFPAQFRDAHVPPNLA